MMKSLVSMDADARSSSANHLSEPTTAALPILMAEDCPDPPQVPDQTTIMTKMMETLQVLSTSIQLNGQQASGAINSGNHRPRPGAGGPVDPNSAEAPEFPTTCRFCITLENQASPPPRLIVTSRPWTSRSPINPILGATPRPTSSNQTTACDGFTSSLRIGSGH
jgi:hypothetical protein